MTIRVEPLGFQKLITGGHANSPVSAGNSVKQIINLPPWIVLAARCKRRVGFRIQFWISGTLCVQNAAITWSLISNATLLFEHVGMFSPFVPMVLFPIAFVT